MKMHTDKVQFGHEGRSLEDFQAAGMAFGQVLAVRSVKRIHQRKLTPEEWAAAEKLGFLVGSALHKAGQDMNVQTFLAATSKVVGRPAA